MDPEINSHQVSPGTFIYPMQAVMIICLFSITPIFSTQHSAQASSLPAPLMTASQVIQQVNAQWTANGLPYKIGCRWWRAALFRQLGRQAI